MKKFVLVAALLVLVSSPSFAASPRSNSVSIPNPIMFVGQVPTPYDFTAVASTFGNHLGDEDIAPRGGDLFILYPTGTLKNVTRSAGFGNTGFQGANSIAVREPCIHWSGTKALFSMVVGAPTSQFQAATFRWQIYEVTNLGEGQTPVITKVPKQPSNFNNVSPIYGTDGRILFTSDRPRSGESHLYPQLDEYEEAATVTGIWSLNPINGDLRLLNHAPSGAFTPSIDSFGRVIFTRWDHLQRDQQADSDSDNPGEYGTFDFSDESAGAQKLNQRVEIFPEPRSGYTPPGSNLIGNNINHFFPWAINEDGTSEETINHIGRHELHNFFARVFNDDPFVTEFIYFDGVRFNTHEAENTFQLEEDPVHPGLYYAVDGPEFDTHASGQIVSFLAPPTTPADQIQVNWITPRSTRDVDDPPAAPDHTGHYRDPLPLSDGQLLAVHTAETRADDDDGTFGHPLSRYDFKIKPLTLQGSFYAPGASLTGGIQATVNYWDPDKKVEWSGELWELSPVEIRVRAIPGKATTPLEQPELNSFAQANVDIDEFRQYLTENNLAVIVSRDVTTRDKADKQQPFNLRVPGGVSHIVDANKKIYDVTHMQLYQADQVRGLGGTPDPNNPSLIIGGRQGRRVLARLMHDSGATAANPPATVTQNGRVTIGLDGSVAAFVPARRAMSWQLTDAAHAGVVRERYWLTFQPGEVRVCASCHGINTQNQMPSNTAPPTNTPAALTALLQFWKTAHDLAPSTPSSVSATATSTTSVSVTWSASAGATANTQYEVARSSIGSGFATVHTTATTNFTDTVSPGVTYVYKVRAIDPAGDSLYSDPDVATTMAFTDDPIIGGTTPGKAVHVTELRSAINLVRAVAGLPAGTYTDPTLNPGMPVKAVHQLELRTALNEARSELGMSSLIFTDATLTTSVTKMRAVHVNELRSGVK